MSLAARKMNTSQLCYITYALHVHKSCILKACFAGQSVELGQGPGHNSSKEQKNTDKSLNRSNSSCNEQASTLTNQRHKRQKKKRNERTEPKYAGQVDTQVFLAVTPRLLMFT